MNPGPFRLLVVDDDAANRDMLARRLRRHGYLVEVAASGADALAFLETEPCDLMLLDIQMPEMDGLEVLRRLRAEASSARLPVVMVTAKTESQDVVAALDIGANDYVTKPIDLPVVLARIRTQLARRHAERALVESEERYAVAVRGANDGLWDWKLVSGEIYLSPRWKEIAGFRDSELANTPDTWFELVHPDDLGRVRAEIDDHLKGRTRHLEVEHRLRHRAGGFRWILARAVAVRDAAGQAVRLAGSITDVTEGKVADALTGLPNRVLFLDRLERLFVLSKRRPEVRFAVLYLDLDGFKTVNDSLGHDVGDQLLILAAHRLESCLRAADTVARVPEEGDPRDTERTVARLGGDEFAVILTGLQSVEDATRAAQRIGVAFRRVFDVAGHEVFANVSIGIAVREPAHNRAEEVLRDADTALHRAKAAGKGRYEIFDETMRQQVVERLDLERDLRRALERHEFILHYQPILSIETGELAALEALLRWEHPVRGQLSPGSFVPIAEEAGLLVPIGLWALAEACRQFKGWIERRPESPLRIAVNVSARQLAQREFAARVGQVIASTGLAPERVELEITESTLIANPDLARVTLDALRALGVHLSLDDFGTGYSSFGYLRAFQFDRLKIDRSFVVDMHDNGDAAGVVRTIVSLGQQLGLDVVAEGIETASQLSQLRALACSHGQGYYFARPMSAADIGILLERGPGRMDGPWSAEPRREPEGHG